MRVLRSWLDDWLDLEGIPTSEISRRLTMAGIEVESITPVAKPSSQVVVAEIISVSPHPRMRLNIAQVRAGEESFCVASGADNLKAGARVLLAKPGGRVGEMEIGERPFGDIISQGMLLSQKEIGAGDDDSGIWILPQDSPPGEDARRALFLDDELLTLKLTPNRGDCLCLRGVAREVGALFGVCPREPVFPSWQVQSDAVLPIFVEDRQACPLYAGAVVEDVAASKQAPLWMRLRLERSGIRSLGAVVDVTNYLMLEEGQPLHAFDLDALGGEITVRRSRGEKLVLLDGKEVLLDQEMLVIASKNPVALAGIMGGKASSVGEGTRRVFLESAHFAPSVVRKTVQKLDLHTEAAVRFSRGVDPAAVQRTLLKACALISAYAGGRAGRLTPIGEAPATPRVALSCRQAKKWLGMEIEGQEALHILERLGFGACLEGDEILAQVPSFRFDIERPQDLAEEILRMKGYESLPSQLPLAPPLLAPPIQDQSRVLLKRAFAARGYAETISLPFVDEGEAYSFSDAPVFLKNPLSQAMAALRSSHWPLLLCMAERHRARQGRGLRAFEVGRVFVKTERGHEEQELLSGIAWGKAFPESWGNAPRDVDLFDVKGDVEAVLAGLTLAWAGGQKKGLHPKMTARLEKDGHALGWMGVLHPEQCRKYNLTPSPVLFEIKLAELARRPRLKAGELLAFPTIRRDFAFLVESTAPVQALVDEIRAAAGAQVTEVMVFDLYEGPDLPSGKKSLGFGVVFAHPERTLTDEEVNLIEARVVARIEDVFGAARR